ncbi:hypothetical protein [Cellulomonas sp. SG140]|uniref:hypothetical protein n=1 Tax=Cellulomonas sp. SG140 TaxID=2976536 RepID=UPI0021E89C54|nr:hypothetical protein [Cellulomonas sp. SG140]
MSTATGTEVRRWIAGRLGVDARGVRITKALADNFNRHHPERPYQGRVTSDFRLLHAAA